MPEHKYTPGPWRIGTPGPNGCYTVGTERGLMTAMVAHSIKYPKQQERAVADANLIAAAPDLLEALEELDAMYARAWDTTDGGLHFSAESVDKFEAAHEKARVAIAKATGQA